VAGGRDGGVKRWGTSGLWLGGGAAASTRWGGRGVGPGRAHSAARPAATIPRALRTASVLKKGPRMSQARASYHVVFATSHPFALKALPSRPTADSGGRRAAPATPEKCVPKGNPSPHAPTCCVPTFIASSAAVTSAMMGKALWRPQAKKVPRASADPAVVPLKALGTGQRQGSNRRGDLIEWTRGSRAMKRSPPR
jgi:hypothetical protein